MKLTLLPFVTAAVVAQSFVELPTDGTHDPDFLSSTEPNSNMCSNADATPVIVDYDVNIDDVVALAYLAKEEHYEIKAVIVTATAFVDAAMGVANTYRLLELLGLSDVEVGIGPLYTQPYWDKTEEFPSDFDGVDFAYARSIPEASKWAANMLYGTYDQFLPYSPRHPTWVDSDSQTPSASTVYKNHIEAGVTTVLTLGSMTSLHRFQLDHPESFAKIETLYSMFGAVDVEGNVFSSENMVSEFNAIADPHSAQAVLSSEIPEIILIPLDATEMVPMTPEYMDSLAELQSAEGRFVSELTHRTRNNWWCNGWTDGMCFYGMDADGEDTMLADAYFFWDPLAVAVMSLGEDIATIEEIQLEVVASTPPNLKIDGWTKRTETAGRVVKVAMSVSSEQAQLVRQSINDNLERDCIDDQPLPLGQLMEEIDDECETDEYLPECCSSAQRRLLFGQAAACLCK